MLEWTNSFTGSFLTKKKPHDSHIDTFLKSPKFADPSNALRSHQSEKEMYEPLALLINNIRELHNTSHPHDWPLDLKCIAQDELSIRAKGTSRKPDLVLVERHVADEFDQAHSKAKGVDDEDEDENNHQVQDKKGKRKYEAKNHPSRSQRHATRNERHDSIHKIRYADSEGVNKSVGSPAFDHKIEWPHVAVSIEVKPTPRGQREPSKQSKSTHGSGSLRASVFWNPEVMVKEVLFTESELPSRVFWEEAPVQGVRT